MRVQRRDGARQDVAGRADVEQDPGPPEPTEQREAGEPQPEEGAGAAARDPHPPVDGPPTGRVADGGTGGDGPSTAPSDEEPAPSDEEPAPSDEEPAPSDEGPAPEDKPRPQAGEGR